MRVRSRFLRAALLMTTSNDALCIGEMAALTRQIRRLKDAPDEDIDAFFEQYNEGV